MEDLILNERNLKENIVKEINESNLPAFILRAVIKDLYEQIVNLEAQQYEEARKTKEAKAKSIEKGAKK